MANENGGNKRKDATLAYPEDEDDQSAHKTLTGPSFPDRSEADKNGEDEQIPDCPLTINVISWDRHYPTSAEEFYKSEEISRPTANSRGVEAEKEGDDCPKAHGPTKETEMASPLPCAATPTSIPDQKKVCCCPWMKN